MDKAIVDSDIFSELFKQKNPRVLAAAERYLEQFPQLSVSSMTVYEIARGLRASQSTTRLALFLRTIQSCEVLDITLPILMRAAELWAVARNTGKPHHDADLIIAATALEFGRVLVSGNTKHYDWINGLQLDDWRSN